MELLLQIDKYDDQINGGGLSSDDIEQIKNELEFAGEIELSERNIGPGADVFVILASILTIANVFSLGDKIDKGIEGWIRIANRIKNLIKKKELVAVDSDGAALLALNFINNLEKVDSIQKTSEQEVALVDFSASHLFGDDRKSEDLISKPYNYYIFSFLINDEKLYVIGVKTNGEVNLIKCFDAFSMYGIREVNITPQQDV